VRDNLLSPHFPLFTGARAMRQLSAPANLAVELPKTIGQYLCLFHQAIAILASE